MTKNPHHLLLKANERGEIGYAFPDHYVVDDDWPEVQKCEELGWIVLVSELTANPHGVDDYRPQRRNIYKLTSLGWKARETAMALEAKGWL